VLRHAAGKARQARVPLGARFVLGCDTEVFCKGRILGKPAGFNQALKMLRLLSGRSHFVYSGVALLDLKTAKLKTGCEKTQVTVRKLADEQIREYICRVHSYDKAGAYGIQTKPKIVKKIKGSYTNVVGLPVELLGRMLKTLK